MVYSFDGYNHLIRLDQGESLQKSLAEFARKADVEGAWLNIIGAAQEVTLGFYNLESKKYQWKTFKQTLEITGLQGNIALDENGGILTHLHGTFAGQDFAAIGGHVKDLTAGATVEIFVHRSYRPTFRKHHAGLGLNLLDL